MEFIIIHSYYEFFNVNVFHAQRMNKHQDLRNYKRAASALQASHHWASLDFTETQSDFWSFLL